MNLYLQDYKIKITGVYAMSDDVLFQKKYEFFGKLLIEIPKIGNNRELEKIQ